MVDRIYWPSGLTPGVRYVPVVLVAGLPFVLTPAGVHPTSTSWTTPSVDPLYWPGDGALQYALPAGNHDPVKEWLDPGQVWEVSESWSPFDGTTKIGELAFDLLDVDGEVTAELSARDARVTALLASDIDTASTAVPLVPGTAGFAASGVAAISRETIIYDGTGGGSLTIGAAPAQRGAFGSRIRAHIATSVPNPPIVSTGPTSQESAARHWQERQCTVWVARLSADGLTIYDPTLWFLGSIGYGIQITARGTRWKIPVASATEVLARKFQPRTLDLYGFAHFRGSVMTPALPTPLLVEWGGATYVHLIGDSTPGSAHNGGWHESWDAFARDWNQQAATVVPGLVVLSGTNPAQIDVQPAAGPLVTAKHVHAPWNSPVEANENSANAWRWTSSRPAPEACFWLNGKLRIPLAADFAKIPTVFTWSSTPPSAFAGLVVTAKTASGQEVSAQIVGRDAATQTLDLLPLVPPHSDEREAWDATLCTARTTARIGLWVSSERWDGTIRIAAQALDALYGTDLLDEAVDWDDLAQQIRLFGCEPNGFACVLGEDDTLLGLLTEQARLHGFTVATRYGRLTVVRAGEFAGTETAALSRATVTDSDLVTEGSGRVESLEVQDVSDGLASSVTYEFPSGDRFRVVDLTYQSEFGDGKDLVVKVPRGTWDAIPRGEVLRVLQERAWTVLGPIAEPYRTVRLPLPPTCLHLQPGDLLTLSSALIPSWSGTRGVYCLCQVLDVRRKLFGGRARAEALVRLTSWDLSGYAPEALVAQNGLDAASLDVILDPASAWGASCFAPETDPEGAAVADAGAGWFAVGELVVLHEIDTRTPIADEFFTVTAVNPVACTVTLDAFPSAAMVAAAAAGQYKVVLSYDQWDSVTTGQKVYSFIADSSYTLGAGSDAPDRWAP